ncbi:MAG: fibrobacter succinogenes major paralogous domain-containing protein [Rikenellaceae bacterium]|nr:fibrobacter succinogenes major paralogous domain-containing protein [Rikenellaceae bacterium]
MEFPAVGGRNFDSSGTLLYAGTYGYYWSSVAYSSNRAYELGFTDIILSVDYTNKQYGQSVRCVR